MHVLQGSIWKLEDPEVLQREREQKLAEAQRKAEAKAEAAKKAAEKEAKYVVRQAVHLLSHFSGA